MNLSKRLQRVAANVMSNGVVADIGCDHGFTSIYLVQRGKASKAIAMDINHGPLARAKEHIVQYNMTDKIALRLSDGAKELEPKEADTLLISGMGGALITRILKESIEVTKAAKELVLSPQSEPHLVRQCIHELGFQIVHEEMLIDQGKYYVVIRAIPGEERYSQIGDYTYGKLLIDYKDDVFVRFLQKEEERVNRILENLSQQSLSEMSARKMKKIEQEKVLILEVKNRMSLA